MIRPGIRTGQPQAAFPFVNRRDDARVQEASIRDLEIVLVTHRAGRYIRGNNNGYRRTAGAGMRSNSLHKTWVEIDNGILRANIRHLRRAIGAQREIIFVVKSDAYGHGAVNAAKVAASEGVTRFAVAGSHEGEELRAAGVTQEIILFHPPLAFEIEACLAAGLSPAISSLENAQLVSAGAAGHTVGLHIELNTGINRLGLDWNTAHQTIAEIAQLDNVRLSGLFTHFRATDPSDGHSIETQLERFNTVVRRVKEQGIDPGLCHAASSHAITRFADSHIAGVRPGMIMYIGANGSPQDGLTQPGIIAPITEMKGVMSVRAHVLHTRHVEAGEWIHYGEMFQAKQPMTVAVVPIGYGMGYSRHFSNNADMIVHGKRAPVVGAVGMDMTMIDVTHIPGVVTGDVVTIMGTDGDETISGFELAQKAGTIVYEIVCRLGSALPRIVTESQSENARLTSGTASGHGRTSAASRISVN